MPFLGTRSKDRGKHPATGPAVSWHAWASKGSQLHITKEICGANKKGL